MVSLLRQHSSFAVLLATIVLIELAHGIELVTLLPLYLTRHFNSGEAWVGLVASTYLLVDTLITRTPAGLAADLWGRRPTLLAGILLSLAPIPLMALAADPKLFVPLNIVNGLGAGMIWPAVYALVADLYGPAQRGTVLALINMVMLGGLAAGGPISGSLLLSVLGYPDPAAFPRGFIACAVLVALALALVLLLVREPPREFRAALSAPLERIATAFPLPRATFALLLAIGLAVTFALGLLVPVLTLFGTNVLKVPLPTFALILLPPALIASIALVPAGRWADRRGRHRPLFAGLALIAVPFWGAALSTHPVVVSAGGSLAALGYALFVPAWNALIMDWIPAERRGLFLGGVATVQGLGLAAGPLLGGRLFGVNPYAPFWLAGLLMTMGAGLAAVLIRSGAQMKERLE